MRGDQTYSLSDVIDNDGTVGISIIHRSQRFISLLTGSIPDFEFHCGALIEGDGLCQEGGADRGLAVIVKLILRTRNGQLPWNVILSHGC